MLTRKGREMALEAELRGLQIVVATMLTFALTNESDREGSLKHLRESIDLSMAAMKLQPIPFEKREAYRATMKWSATNVIDMAAAPRAARTTGDQRQQ